MGLGAASVTSFDFDPDSVGCTEELRRRRGVAAEQWRVLQGSLLDAEFLAGLGTFDVVYCWGVAHHTGSMWEALGNLADRVAPGGRLFVAIYNDQGWRSRVWHAVKHGYVRGGAIARPPLVVASLLAIYGARAPIAVVRGGTSVLTRRRHRSGTAAAPDPRHRARARGMSWWYDLIDWVGGYPFEVARPEEIFRFYADRSFALEALQTCGGGLGCNQLVFRKVADPLEPGSAR
jgi:2-polyprenyl-6-hydroxyphenyl methylase/3-demethylubiquinone-9 3-methyltransferase